MTGEETQVESPSTAIEAVCISKRYGAVSALSGLSFTVEEGSVLGLLGHNGAGKSTAVRILTTVESPDTGSAKVAGLDTRRDAHRVRQRIGVLAQSPTVDDRLSARANLMMIAALCRVRRPVARARIGELLEQYGLLGREHQLVKTYSGGMRRRLDLAASLIGKPSIVFLDEPTTGLDPTSRQAVWDAIRTLKREGTTVLLTTQYLEEADALTDRLVFLADGMLVAEGTARDLKRRVALDTVEFDFGNESIAISAAGKLSRTDGVSAVTRDSAKVVLQTLSGRRTAPQLVRELADEGLSVRELDVRQPTLDDVFFNLSTPREGR